MPNQNPQRELFTCEQFQYHHSKSHARLPAEARIFTPKGSFCVRHSVLLQNPGTGAMQRVYFHLL